jgi:hypothetical protein
VGRYEGIICTFSTLCHAYRGDLAARENLALSNPLISSQMNGHSKQYTRDKKGVNRDENMLYR